MSDQIRSKFTVLGAALSLSILSTPQAIATGVITSPQMSQSSDDAQTNADGQLAVFVELVGSSATEVFNLERRRFVESRAQSGLSVEELTAQAERAAARLAFATAAELTSKQRVLIEQLSAQFNGRILFNSRFANNGKIGRAHV